MMDDDVKEGAHSFSVKDKWPEEVLKKGFTAVPNSLIKCRAELDITMSEFFVLVAIDSYRWDNWKHPFPSVETLSNLTGLSVRQLTRITGSLQRKHLIRKIRRFNKTNAYDLRQLGEELAVVLRSWDT